MSVHSAASRTATATMMPSSKMSAMAWFIVRSVAIFSETKRCPMSDNLFLTESQSSMDFGLPLVEKYRPGRIDILRCIYYNQFHEKPHSTIHEKGTKTTEWMLVMESLHQYNRLWPFWCMGRVKDSRSLCTSLVLSIFGKEALCSHVASHLPQSVVCKSFAFAFCDSQEPPRCSTNAKQPKDSLLAGSSL